MVTETLIQGGTVKPSGNYTSVAAMTANLARHSLGDILKTSSFYSGSAPSGAADYVVAESTSAANRPSEKQGLVYHDGVTPRYALSLSVGAERFDLASLGLRLDGTSDDSAAFQAAARSVGRNQLILPDGKVLYLASPISTDTLNLVGGGKILCGVDAAIKTSGFCHINGLIEIDANGYNYPLDCIDDDQDIYINGLKISNVYSATDAFSMRVVGGSYVYMPSLTINSCKALANSVTGDGDGSISGLRLAGPITRTDIERINGNDVYSVDATGTPVREDADLIHVSQRNADSTYPEWVRVQSCIAKDIGKRAFKGNTTLGDPTYILENFHVESSWPSGIGGATDVNNGMACLASCHSGSLTISGGELTGGPVGSVAVLGSNSRACYINGFESKQASADYVSGNATTFVFAAATGTGFADTETIEINSCTSTAVNTLGANVIDASTVKIKDSKLTYKQYGVLASRCGDVSVSDNTFTRTAQSGASSVVLLSGGFSSARVQSNESKGIASRYFLQVAGSALSVANELTVTDNKAIGTTLEWFKDDIGGVLDRANTTFRNNTPDDASSDQFNFATTDRPMNVSAGFSGFDTTLGQPVWYNGSAWVNSSGVAV